MSYRLAFDVLHQQIRPAVGGGAAVEQSCDVRVVEAREYLAFVSKPAQDELGVHAALDEFYRDSLFELIVGAFREIDSSHAALSDLADDSVWADVAFAEQLGLFFLGKGYSRRVAK